MVLDFLNKKILKFSGKKGGFTLAELMIVLAVLAVISAILLPAAFHSMPDENRLKFKKGYYTLKRTIDGMVNSEAYSQTEGQFGQKLENEATDKPAYAASITSESGLGDIDGDTYFCVQFSEMLNSVQTQCKDFINSTGLYTKKFDVSDITGAEADPTAPSASTLDGKCAGFLADEAGKQYINVSTQDGIYWSVPRDNFSGTDAENHKWSSIKGFHNVPAYYAVLCMDVDGVGGESAFGFGIRHDGKVVAGAKAKTWLQEGTTTIVPSDDE